MCNLTPQQKELVIQCIDVAFKNGHVRGPVEQVAQITAQAAEIIRQLSEPEQGKAAEKPK